MEKKLEQATSDCLKVVLFGPESTGKTNLAQKLAAHFNTEWVPEFSRDFLQDKWEREKEICSLEDIVPIAEGQMQLENELASKARKVLFCDTNILETAVYSQAYFEGYCDPRVLKSALKAEYDLYFLMYIDVPWVADDLRDRPQQRELMFDQFKTTLDVHQKPYKIIRGDFQQRFEATVKAVEELLKNHKVELK